MSKVYYYMFNENRGLREIKKGIKAFIGSVLNIFCMMPTGIRVKA